MLLEARDLVIWSTIWGGMTSIIVVLYAIYTLLLHKEHRRINY
jgi:hypothetical protein